MLLRCSLVRCVTSSAAAARRIATHAAMGKKQVYAVAEGRRPGLYKSWDECRQQVDGYRGNKYAGFATEDEAQRYLLHHGVDADLVALPPAQTAHQQSAAQAEPAPPEPAPAARRKRKAPDAAQQAAPAAATAQRSTGRIDADTTVRLEFDGASKRNPGPSGWGAVLYDDATGAELARSCQYMGDHHTNNQAEYAGLVAGLAAALELGCRRIRVQGDSTLIIRQVLGEWQVKNEGLQPYHAAATALARRFTAFSARQVPREQNTVADALSNQAIDDFRSGSNPWPWRLEEAGAWAAAGVAARDDSEAGATAQGGEETAAAGGADGRGQASGNDMCGSGSGRGGASCGGKQKRGKRPRL